MWCEQCERPVAAQKSTHRARNTAAALAAPLTTGVSLAGAAAGQWHCPNCGGPVRPVERQRSANPADAWMERKQAAASTRPRQLLIAYGRLLSELFARLLGGQNTTGEALGAGILLLLAVAPIWIPIALIVEAL